VDSGVGSGYSQAYGASDGRSVGIRTACPDTNFSCEYAVLWNGTTNSWTPLMSEGYCHTDARGIWGDQIVGSGLNCCDFGDCPVPPAEVNVFCHALLWQGTDKCIDLHPKRFEDSFALGTDGATQVGAGTVPGQFIPMITPGFPTCQEPVNHALLWHGSAASCVDLNPAGIESSCASGVSGIHQVGDGFGPSTHSNYHAFLWTGTAGSAVDLNPAGFKTTTALSISGTQIVGNGNGPATGGQNHALLWSTDGSYVDLNASSMSCSYATATNGTLQVGYAWGNGPLGGQWNGKDVYITFENAIVWNGSAGSYVDLQQFLPSDFYSSEADGIDAQGDIFGYACSSDFRGAVMWVPIPGTDTYEFTPGPVPEPGTLVLLTLGSLGLCRRKK
jgi:hypothetical protein